jgi:hypothetical protein
MSFFLKRLCPTIVFFVHCFSHISCVWFDDGGGVEQTLTKTGLPLQTGSPIFLYLTLFLY